MDFKELIETWAITNYFKSQGKMKYVSKLLNSRKGGEMKDFHFDTSLEQLRLQYENEKWDIKQPNGTSCLEVFRSGDYYNELSDFSVRVQHEEKTHAKCTLILEKGKICGLEACASISLPDEVREATTKRPFGDSILLDHDEVITEKEAEQNWTIDANVPILKNTHTNITMTIQESRLQGSFSCTACLKGSVAVQIFNKNDNKSLTTIDGDIFDIVTEFQELMKQNENGEKGKPKANKCGKHGVLNLVSEMTCESRMVKWQVAGQCTFQVGRNQKIDVMRQKKSKGSAPQPSANLSQP